MHCNRFHSHTLLLCNKQIWASWIPERSSRAHLSISTSQILSAMSWHRYIPAHCRKGMAPTLHLLLSHPPTHPCLLCESFYAAPESAGPSRFSPYSSLYRASASGSTASRSRRENAQRSQVEYWKLPGRETKLAIIRIAFLKGHIYKMRRWDNIVSETMISVYLEQSMEFLGAIPQTLRTSTSFHRLTAVIHLTMIEFQTDDPDVVKCVKARGPVFCHNDCTTLQDHMYANGIYGLPNIDQMAIVQITQLDAHLHLLNSNVSPTSPLSDSWPRTYTQLRARLL